MSAGPPRAEYARRLHRVVEHIDRHLAEPLDLAGLAEVAHFSRFHFHRLFAAWMGETLGDYLRRRRVEVAAAQLLSQPRLSVLQAALGVGFGSGEAFSRAFRVRFGEAPSTWRVRQRRQRNPGQVPSNPGQAAAVAPGEHGGLHSLGARATPAMKVRVLDLHPSTVACLRHTGPYGEPIGRFWREVVAPWRAGQGLLGRPAYGICHDDPDTTDAARCRYDACVEVEPGWQPPPPAFVATLPGGRYAVLPFVGRSDQIGAAWDGLLRDWLPDSGLQLDARACLERYPAQPALDGVAAPDGSFACELCMPVAPL